jgi:cyclopropane-fatty-acyl-phospholipid synthase
MTGSWIDASLLRAVRRLVGAAPVCFRLPEAAESHPESLVPTIRFDSRATLARVVLDPEIGFGDAYATGKIEIDGPLVDVLEAFYRTAQPRTWFSRVVSGAMRIAQRNSRNGSRRNIHQHYDMPTDFYQLWLDPLLVYTCAYFPEPQSTLEEAQAAKLDLVCRKLMLRPGERVVDAGCGWGALALHMARNYGVRVRAFNISRAQIAYARQQARRAGLDGQVEFIEEDYRNIAGQYDVFVSVGMLEHVGRENYREFGAVIRRIIGDTGRGLVHFIGRDTPQRFSPWIRKRIFPGAYVPSLREALIPLEHERFSVSDVENLRQHYARTVEHWLLRFERSYAYVAERFGEEFARSWRLYLAGSVAAFRTGSLQLFQVVFHGRHCQAVPWTRAHLYEPRQEQEETWNRAAS